MIHAFEKIRKLKKELRDHVASVGMDAIREAIFEPVFNDFPEIDAMEWSQYTPFFNDGDACIFSVNEITLDAPEFADMLEMDNPFDTYSINYYIKQAKKITPDQKIRLQALAKAVSNINKIADDNDDVWQQVFDDHTTISIKRGQSFNVEECDHE